MTWQPGNYVTFEDWQGVIRTGQIKHAARDLLVVTHILDDKKGNRWRINETIGLDQLRDGRSVA